MRCFTWLASGLLVLLAGGASAASLNKCIDAQGKVTYSNLPCTNAREMRKVEIDPAPAPEPVHVTPRPKLEKPAADAPESKEPPVTKLRLDSAAGNARAATKPTARHCDALADKLGLVLDKMDDARRKGYTQKQMDDWNQDVKELERKKQQAGCF
ncbi:MAG: DUF4124 domain-containing protein [Thiobacillus sp.]|nr:DUF4124 domain-containing protein [Thiobacillus sp.]